MGNSIVVCLYNGILLCNKNKPITDKIHNMNESCRHHIEGKMQTKGHRLCGSIHPKMAWGGDSRLLEIIKNNQGDHLLGTPQAKLGSLWP